jgi:hypothetical protein
VDKIACYVPAGSLLDFSYVGEHVSDDVAVGALEGLVQSVEAVIADSKVPGNWPEHLSWLNDALSEVWSDRGPFPGIGSVLRFLGMPRGTLFQRTALTARVKRGEDPWLYLQSVLEGKRDLVEADYRTEVKGAAARWTSYSEERRKLLATLARFELNRIK